MQAELSCAPAGAASALSRVEIAAGWISSKPVELWETLTGYLLIGGLGLLGFQLEAMVHPIFHC